ncbi:hypothetical protein [Emcibacter sp. SYSU 3D8]|uniref:hypothetical protein n=1 Tax=Emcibacter sp. SYSU 3D8 TaxID=3133969 RepID=UPI0031FED8CF
MNEARPNRRLLKLCAAGAVGILLGLAITVTRIIATAPTPEDELAAALDNNAVFQLAIRHDPSLRDVYLARLKTAYAAGGIDASASEAHAIGQEIGRAYSPMLLATASDAALADFLDVTTEYLADAYDSDPDGCYAFARGHVVNGNAPLPPDIRNRLGNVMLNLVATATSAPVTMSPDEWMAGRAKVEEIRASLAQGEEADRMYFGGHAGRPASNAAERKGTCLFLARVYQKLGRTDAPLRYLALRAMSAPKPRPKPQESFKDSV